MKIKLKKTTTTKYKRKHYMNHDDSNMINELQQKKIYIHILFICLFTC